MEPSSPPLSRRGSSNLHPPKLSAKGRSLSAGSFPTTSKESVATPTRRQDSPRQDRLRRDSAAGTGTYVGEKDHNRGTCKFVQKYLSIISQIVVSVMHEIWFQELDLPKEILLAVQAYSYEVVEGPYSIVSISNFFERVSDITNASNSPLVNTIKNLLAKRMHLEDKKFQYEVQKAVSDVCLSRVSFEFIDRLKEEGRSSTLASIAAILNVVMHVQVCYRLVEEYCRDDSCVVYENLTSEKRWSARAYVERAESSAIRHLSSRKFMAFEKYTWSSLCTILCRSLRVFCHIQTNHLSPESFSSWRRVEEVPDRLELSSRRMKLTNTFYAPIGSIRKLLKKPEQKLAEVLSRTEHYAVAFPCESYIREDSLLRSALRRYPITVRESDTDRSLISIVASHHELGDVFFPPRSLLEIHLGRSGETMPPETPLRLLQLTSVPLEGFVCCLKHSASVFEVALYFPGDIISRLEKLSADQLQERDANRRTILHYMCALHTNNIDIQVEAIKYVLRSSNLTVNDVDVNGLTCVMCAVISNNGPVMRALARMESVKMDLEIRDSTGWNVINYACGSPALTFFDRYFMLAILHRNGADLHGRVPSTRDTPLMLACQAGCLDSVLGLIEHGVHPYLRNNKYEAALPFAIRSRNLTLVRYLVRKYPLLAFLTNAAGGLPIGEVREIKDEVLRETMMEIVLGDTRLPPPELLAYIQKDEADQVLSWLTNMNKPQSEEPGLGDGKGKGKQKMKLLHESDGLVADDEGSVIGKKERKSNREKKKKNRLRRKTMVMCPLNLQDVILFAAAFSALNVVEALLPFCDPWKPNQSGICVPDILASTALLHKNYGSLFEKIIIDKTAGLPHRTPTGETLLHLAAIGENLHGLQIVSRHIPCQNSNNYSEESELHYAVKTANLRVVMDLLSAGSDPLLRSLSHGTPLDYARAIKCKEVAEALGDFCSSKVDSTQKASAVNIATLKVLRVEGMGGKRNSYTIHLRHKIGGKTTEYRVPVKDGIVTEENCFRVALKVGLVTETDVEIYMSYSCCKRHGEIIYGLILAELRGLGGRETQSLTMVPLLDQSVVKLECEVEYFKASGKEEHELFATYGVHDGNARILELKRRTKEKLLGKAMQKDGYTPHYPVIIIPGFAASSLEAVQSTKTSWQGEKVWVDPLKIGKAAMMQNMKSKSDGSDRHTRLSRAWLHHMLLNERDGISDPSSIKLRAVGGLHGVDYLSDHPLARKASYCFAKLIGVLQDIGYDDTNLDAAPYDWRLPPSELEKRDKFMSKLKSKIELFYHINDKTRVMLLGHSMGNRVAQYFLKWVKENYGQEWIDMHVQSLVALGGPFLGAAKTVRAVVLGDALGLEFFVTPHEARLMARCSASLPWLFPIAPALYPDVVCRIRKAGAVRDTYSEQSLEDAIRKGGHKSWDFFSTYHTPDPLLYAGKTVEDLGVPLMDAPPVENLIVINGVNLATEIAYYFQPYEGKGRLYLDPSASKFSNERISSINPKGFYISGGIAYETKSTCQNGVHRSGDGTVSKPFQTSIIFVI